MLGKIETYNQYVEKKNQENDAEHQLEKTSIYCSNP